MTLPTINLATQPIEKVRAARRLVGRVIGVLLVALLIQASAIWWLGSTPEVDIDPSLSVDAATLRAWEVEVDSLARVADVQRGRAAAAAVDLGNQLIAWRTIPWVAIFAAVEESLPDQVRLESIEPITEPGSGVRVVITAAARDPGPLQDLLVALEQHRGFRGVYPLQELFGSDGLYRIDLQARYVEQSGEGSGQ